MIRLNHPIKVNKEIITPYLIEGENVLCFNQKKQTISYPLKTLDKKRKIKKIIIPQQILAPSKTVITPVKKKKEIIKVKKKEEPMVFKMKQVGSIGIYGSADISFVKKEVEVAPPVVDNNRFIRPTLDDDYI